MREQVCRPRSSIAPQTYTPDLLVAEIAAEQHGQISTRQLCWCGLNSQAICLRVRDGRLHRVHRGVYSVGHPGLTREARFMAAVLACRERAYLSHFSAAAHDRYLTWEERRIEVTVIRGGARTIEGLRVHRSRSLDISRDVWTRAGIPTTTPARTLLDLAPLLAEFALRRAARQAQAMRLVSVRQILELTARCRFHHGAAKLRAVVADGPTPTASPLEDNLLDLLDGAGIERPEVNAPLRLGGRRIVPDYLWRDRMLAIEADSRTWHDHTLTLDNDADKQAILEAAGYRVLRITSDQCKHLPEQTLQRVRTALAATS